MKYLKISKRFAGHWRDRMEGLFDLGVDYSGKRVLDIGSNMGVVAYEIAKREPASIHGIEKYWPHVRVARHIFTAVPVESRFDCAKVGGRFFQGKLRSEYDIVLMLAVYYHIYRKLGAKRAEAALKQVLPRCKSTIIFADQPGASTFDFVQTARSFGFREVGARDRGNGGPIIVMSKE